MVCEWNLLLMSPRYSILFELKFRKWDSLENRSEKEQKLRSKTFHK